jgi:hypothetical protein
MDGFCPEEIGDLYWNGLTVRAGHHCAQSFLHRIGLECMVRAL